MPFWLGELGARECGGRVTVLPPKPIFISELLSILESRPALTHRLGSEQALSVFWQSAVERIAIFPANSESGGPKRLISFRREDRVFCVCQSVRKIKREVQAATLLSMQSTFDN